MKNNNQINYILWKNPYRVKLLQINPHKHRKTVALAVLKEDWDLLAAESAHLRESAISTFNNLECEAKMDDRRLYALEKSSMEVDEAINQHREYLDDPANNEEIETKLTEAGKNMDDLKRIMDYFKENSFLKKIEPIKESRSIRISNKLSYTTAIGQEGYWAGFHAAFNKFFPDFANYFENSQKFPTKNDFDELSNQIIEMENNINNKLINIYSNYVLGDKSAIRTTCLEILLWQARELDWIARVCALLSASTQVALKKPTRDSLFLGPKALAAGRTARLWALLATIALLSTRIAILPKNHTDVREIIKAAQKLPYLTHVKDGKNIRVRDLVNKSEKYNEKYVEIKGFIKDSKATRTEDGKLLSTFTLYEPLREESIQVVSIFEHLQHVGIINGCYVQLNGDWKEKNFLGQDPILQVRRLQLSKLAKQSWLDKIVVVAQPWFEYYPNSHFISWSIGPEQKGEMGIQSHNTGAAELMFRRPYLIKKGGK